MNKKARAIRKYLSSFGMTRQQAEAHYEAMQAKDAKRAAAAARIPSYYSDELKRRVTVPA